MITDMRVFVSNSRVENRLTHQRPRLFTSTVDSAASLCVSVRASVVASTGGIGNPATSWVRLSTCSTKLVRGTKT